MRPVQEHDFEDFYEIYSDTETLRYFAHSPTKSHQDAKALVADKIAANQGEHRFYWAVCLTESGKMIGHFTLFNFSKYNLRAEVGYIFNRNYWGNGYASEMLATMIEYCFGPLGMARLEADADPQNSGSLRLLEKHGFEREGYFRKRWYFEETWYDSVMLGLLKPGLA